jgi:hypothetical protein
MPSSKNLNEKPYKHWRVDAEGAVSTAWFLENKVLVNSENV